MERTKEKLSDTDREKIDSLADGLISAFHWGKTSSGRKYWEGVYYKLRELGWQK